MFDEEPEGDVHSGCALEIHRLQAENKELRTDNKEMFLFIQNMRLKGDERYEREVKLEAGEKKNVKLLAVVEALEFYVRSYETADKGDPLIELAVDRKIIIGHRKLLKALEG